MKKYLLALIVIFGAIQLVAQEVKYERVFIRLDENTSIEELVRQGVKPECVFGNTITARVPKGQLDKISGAKSVTVGRRFQLYNDVARQLTKIDLLHPAADRPEGYTGKGVIVGMIDCGTDLTHIAFKDAQGNCRIKRAYLPEEQSQAGHAVVLDGNEVPGREFITEDEILAIGTDSDEEFHGTHTAATAAGSYMGNQYYGMAPEADLVICTMPPDKLTDVNLVNSIKYIVNYAREKEQPVVINMSLGDVSGPHDGTSELCRVIDQYSGPGVIFVLAAGNSGDYSVYLEKLFEKDGDVLRTFLDDNYIKGNGISAWHDGAQLASMRFMLVDKSTNEVAYRSDNISKEYTKAEGDTIELSKLIDTKALGLEGNLLVSVNKSEDNGKFNIYLMTDLQKCENHHIGIEITAEPGTFLRAWNVEGHNFSKYGVEGYCDGLFRSNESDMVSCKTSISVGAYKSRDRAVRDDGNIIVFERGELEDLAYFSSYGPDANGVDHPMVVAPGYKVVSAFNNYAKDGADKWVHKEEVDGVSYTWIHESGTSMSTPVVAGAVALWLQAKPDLTPEEVMYVLQKSSVRDQYVEKAPTKWGFGKLDASAGMKVVKELAGIDGSLVDNGDQFVVRDNDITVLAAEPVYVYSVSGILVAAYSQPGTYSTASWQPGIYIVKTKTTARKVIH